MTIRTNVDHIDPSGALVYIDDYEIGTTPISTNFTYYGTRRVRLVKEGYETLTVMQPISPPWWQIPPLDFVTENLIPGELRDRRTLCYQLRPQVEVPQTQLRARAEELRARGRVPLAVAPSGFSSPVPADPFQTTPGPTPMPGPIESVPVPAGQPSHPPGSLPPQTFVPNGSAQPGMNLPPRAPSQPAQPQNVPWTVPASPNTPPNGWQAPPGPAGRY